MELILPWEEQAGLVVDLAAEVEVPDRELAVEAVDIKDRTEEVFLYIPPILPVLVRLTFLDKADLMEEQVVPTELLAEQAVAAVEVASASPSKVVCSANT